MNLCCDLDLERNNPIFAKDTPAYDVVLSNQVWLQTDQQFRRFSRNSHISIISALPVTLTLKTAPNYFQYDTLAHDACITIPSLVTKCFAVQKILSTQTFTNILNFCCDLDLECSNPLSSQDTLAYDDIRQTKFACRRINSSEDTVERVIF